MKKKRTLYVIWFEDVKTNRTSLMYSLEPNLIDMGLEFQIDEHDSARHIDSISRAIEVDLLLVDQNLKKSNGNEFEGNMVINEFLKHKHNEDTPIVYHSSFLDGAALQELVPVRHNVHCVHRNDLEETILMILRNL